MMQSFVEDLENIYSNELIYRTIIVCNPDDSNEMKKLLENYGHNVFIVSSYDEDIQFASLDARVLLVSYDIFKQFVLHLYTKYSYHDVLYNMIAFCYDMDDELIRELKYWYEQIKKNEDIIII